jgi:hypothetical protein
MRDVAAAKYAAPALRFVTALCRDFAIDNANSATMLNHQRRSNQALWTSVVE